MNRADFVEALARNKLLNETARVLLVTFCRDPLLPDEEFHSGLLVALVSNRQHVSILHDVALGDQRKDFGKTIEFLKGQLAERDRSAVRELWAKLKARFRR